MTKGHVSISVCAGDPKPRRRLHPKGVKRTQKHVNQPPKKKKKVCSCMKLNHGQPNFCAFFLDAKIWAKIGICECQTVNICAFSMFFFFLSLFAICGHGKWDLVLFALAIGLASRSSSPPDHSFFQSVPSLKWTSSSHLF